MASNRERTHTAIDKQLTQGKQTITINSQRNGKPIQKQSMHEKQLIVN